MEKIMGFAGHMDELLSLAACISGNNWVTDFDYSRTKTIKYAAFTIHAATVVRRL